MSRYEQYQESYQQYRQTHRVERAQVVREWREKNPEKYRIHTIIMHHPEEYPIDAQCVFCGATSNLEHAHLDYEDNGHNYVTACHGCNMWMEKEGELKCPA